jgi:hypothetical protein
MSPSRATDAHVETECGQVTCVLTRFGLRSAWRLIPLYMRFRRVRNDLRAANVDGYLMSAFLVGNWRSCFTLSIWESPAAIPDFGTAVPSHVEVVRNSFHHFCFNEDDGPELWSTTWRLARASNNLHWRGFDLRHALADGGHPQ